MKSINYRATTGLLAVSASFLLIACGSGNNTAPVAGPTNVGSTDVPLAAMQDSAAAFSFIESVVAKGAADTETPLVLSDATNDPQLAMSDNTEPMMIIV